MSMRIDSKNIVSKLLTLVGRSDPIVFQGWDTGNAGIRVHEYCSRSPIEIVRGCFEENYR